MANVGGTGSEQPTRSVTADDGTDNGAIKPITFSAAALRWAAAAIVRDLAKFEAPVGDASDCVYCGNLVQLVRHEHRPDCVWLRARRWAEASRGRWEDVDA